MILRRFISHVKSENWFAVTIDFLVVVLGIFIGMQVNEWNNGRLDRQLEKEYVERLRAEVDENITTYEYVIGELRNSADIYLNYFDHLENPEVKINDLEVLTSMLCRNGISSVPFYNNSVYDELIATGSMSLIRDEEVRGAFRSYKAQQLSILTMNSNVAPVMRDNFVALKPYRDMKPLRDGVGLGPCDFDFESFEKHPKASSLVAELQKTENIQSELNARVLESLKTLKNFLEGAYPNSRL